MFRFVLTFLFFVTDYEAIDHPQGDTAAADRSERDGLSCVHLCSLPSHVFTIENEV